LIRESENIQPDRVVAKAVAILPQHAPPMSQSVARAIAAHQQSTQLHADTVFCRVLNRLAHVRDPDSEAADNLNGCGNEDFAPASPH
jgi:hypothetical protein